MYRGDEDYGLRWFDWIMIVMTWFVLLCAAFGVGL